MDKTPLGNIILSASAEDLTLVGMNQDNPNSPATFTLFPAADGAPEMIIFGSVDEFECGMNENGLMLGLSPSPTLDVEYSAEKKTFEGSPWQAILDSCSKVTDVLSILDEYNLYGLESCQVFIADKSGDAAVLGIGEDKQINLLKKDDWFLILSGSNRFQTAASKQVDYRYDVTKKMLIEKAAVSFHCFRDILSITHSEGLNTTIYSIIFNLSKNDMYLYYFHDFSHGVKFNLHKAIEKESAQCTFKIASLFPIRHPYFAQTSLEIPKPVIEEKIPHKAVSKSRRKTRLSSIKGIGDAYESKLKEIGIHSIEALLSQGATPKGRLEISENSSISDGLILSWVNRADLCRIKGVGNEYSDLLELAGVDTVPELAQRNAENLYQKLVEVNDEKNIVQVLPSQGQVEEWINQAKDLPRIVFY